MFKTNSLFSISKSRFIIQNLIKQQHHNFSAKVTPKKDYYAILGVKNTASISEIKKAYRRLAKTYHPDVSSKTKNSKDEVLALEMFRQVSEAYAVLSNPTSKLRYDVNYQPSPEAVFNASKMKAMDDSKKERDNAGNPIDSEEYSKGSYASMKLQNTKRIQKEMNLDSLGNFKGGVPRRHSGGERGSAQGVPGAPFDGYMYNESHADQIMVKQTDNEDVLSHKHFQNLKKYQNTRYRPYFSIEKVGKEFSSGTTKEYQNLFSIPFMLLVLFFGYKFTSYLQSISTKIESEEGIEDLPSYTVDTVGPIVINALNFKFEGQKLMSRADYHDWLANNLRTFK